MNNAIPSGSSPEDEEDSGPSTTTSSSLLTPERRRPPPAAEDTQQEQDGGITTTTTTLFPSQYNTIGPNNDNGIVQGLKRRRLDYLEDFLRQLDSLLFVQFSILYYYDNTFILFILRATVQAFFLTPRPASSLSESPLHRPSVGAIGASNLWCLLLHLIRANPQAGEITEGFLHGGIIIDFVGELGPIWKWRLVVMDLLILGLQLVMLAGTLEKFSLKALRPGGVEGPLPPPITQDHDAEERGVIRDESREEEEPEDMPVESTTLESAAATTTGHALDPLYTGDYTITNLSLLGTLRRQWGVFQNGATSGVLTRQNVRNGNDMTMLFGGLLGVRLRFRGRNLGV